MKRIRFLFLTAMLALAGVSESFAASFDAGPGVQNIPFEMLMENVDPYMLNAGYWTDGPGNKRILMNEYQIRDTKCFISEKETGNTIRSTT